MHQVHSAEIICWRFVVERFGQSASKDSNQKDHQQLDHFLARDNWAVSLLRKVQGAFWLQMYHRKSNLLGLTVLSTFRFDAKVGMFLRFKVSNSKSRELPFRLTAAGRVRKCWYFLSSFGLKVAAEYSSFGETSSTGTETLSST